MAWTYLVLAGALEIVWAFFMKKSSRVHPAGAWRHYDHHDDRKLRLAVDLDEDPATRHGLHDLDRHRCRWRIRCRHHRARRSSQSHAAPGRRAHHRRDRADETLKHRLNATSAKMSPFLHSKCARYAAFGCPRYDPSPMCPEWTLITVAHPTRFERVTFAFGGQLNRSRAFGFSQVLNFKVLENAANQGEYIRGPPFPRSSLRGGISVTVVTAL